MVSNFLAASTSGDTEVDAITAERGRVPAREATVVFDLAVRARLGGPDAPMRAYALGQAVRLFGLVGMLVSTALRRYM